MVVDKLVQLLSVRGNPHAEGQHKRVSKAFLHAAVGFEVLGQQDFRAVFGKTAGGEMHRHDIKKGIVRLFHIKIRFIIVLRPLKARISDFSGTRNPADLLTLFKALHAVF